MRLGAHFKTEENRHYFNMEFQDYVHSRGKSNSFFLFTETLMIFTIIIFNAFTSTPT